MDGKTCFSSARFRYYGEEIYFSIFVMMKIHLGKPTLHVFLPAILVWSNVWYYLVLINNDYTLVRH